jgi:hypothetical protein
VYFGHAPLFVVYLPSASLTCVPLSFELLLVIAVPKEAKLDGTELLDRARLANPSAEVISPLHLIDQQLLLAECLDLRVGCFVSCCCVYSRARARVCVCVCSRFFSWLLLLLAVAVGDCACSCGLGRDKIFWRDSKKAPSVNTQRSSSLLYNPHLELQSCG